MSRSSLSSLIVAVLLAFLLAGWGGAEERAFFGSLFQDAALFNSTSGGPLGQFAAALTAGHPHSLAALSNLFFGK